MAKKLYDEYNIQAIANAIRSKNGSTTTYKASEMAAAVEAIPQGGITPSGTVSITANGSVDVTNYATANVNVPQGITPSGTVSITENGTVDVTNYASAEVVVPQGIEPSGTISITANGSYTVREYESATVNVQGGGGITPTGSVSITENGTVDVTQYASAVVNVPSSGNMIVASGSDAIASNMGTTSYRFNALSDAVAALDDSYDYCIRIHADAATIELIKADSVAALIDVVSAIPIHTAKVLGGSALGSTYLRMFGKSSDGTYKMTYQSSTSYRDSKYVHAGTYLWEIIKL